MGSRRPPHFLTPLAQRLQARLELHFSLVRLVLAGGCFRQLGIHIGLIREPGGDLALMVLRCLLGALQLVACR